MPVLLAECKPCLSYLPHCAAAEQLALTASCQHHSKLQANVELDVKLVQPEPSNADAVTHLQLAH